MHEIVSVSLKYYNLVLLLQCSYLTVHEAVIPLNI